jgi:U3 small nucleolar RNA-associated protein 14
MKPLYEIFDEFEEAKSKKERMDVLGKNLSPMLVEVLKLTYHPNYQWIINDIPENYKIPQDVLPGITHDTLNNQLRRIYIVQKGNETAEKLTPKRRNELVIQMLESLEPREAEIIGGILRKDQGVKGLDYKFVKEAFKDMLP